MNELNQFLSYVQWFNALLAVTESSEQWSKNLHRFVQKKWKNYKISHIFHCAIVEQSMSIAASASIGMFLSLQSYLHDGTPAAVFEFKAFISFQGKYWQKDVPKKKMTQKKNHLDEMDDDDKGIKINPDTRDSRKNVQLWTNPHKINGTEKLVNAPDSFFFRHIKRIAFFERQKRRSFASIMLLNGSMMNCTAIAEKVTTKNGTLFVDKQKFINPRVRVNYRDFINSRKGIFLLFLNSDKLKQPLFLRRFKCIE